MPLPASGTPWPPVDLAPIAETQRRLNAWYVGDPAGLEEVYRGSSSSGGPLRLDRPSQYRGGVSGALSRFFWGRPVGDLAAPQPRRLHVPIAADICQAGADLIWSEAPTITAASSQTRDLLDALVDDGMLQVCAEAAELGAALGDSYLRVTWDREIRPDAPFLTAVDADAAWPEFRWGTLQSVTFWWVLRQDGQMVIRHLERHELDSQGHGIILHGLYSGTTSDLGRPIPLTEHPSTAGLADLVDADGAISTLSPGLAVVHVPNARPQRALRAHSIGRNLGRSDLDAVLGHMDALDEVYSSWMRDIRLGKARLIAPAAMLQDLGPGKGAVFDLDREVYEGVNTMASTRDGGLPITAQQFGIRHEEHRATAHELVRDILRTAGYSPATFGEDEASAQVTATEVLARQQRSYQTRDRKLRIVRPRIADIIAKLVATHVALGFGVVPVERPEIVFPDGVQESMLQLAQTAQALRSADAASTRVLVQMVHPEWDEEQVDREVAAIAADAPAPLPTLADPTASPSGAGPGPLSSGSSSAVG